MQEIKDVVSNWIEAQLLSGATFMHANWDKLISDLSNMETKEIKLNEPFNLEGKMVKIVECMSISTEMNPEYVAHQPKKERWFKCIESYKKAIKGVLYKRPSSHSGGTVMIGDISYAWFDLEDFNKYFEEVTPDFVCQQSGEGFMLGDKYWYVEALEKDDNPCQGTAHRNSQKYICANFAYFRTSEDALAWQEKKFGKKEEEKKQKFRFDKKTFFIYEEPIITDAFISDEFDDKSDCIAAREKYIIENEKLTCREVVEVMTEWDYRTSNTATEYLINYILNKKGGNK